MDKESRKINVYVRDREVTLSEGLTEQIYKEVVEQFSNEVNLNEIDFEIEIEVVHEGSEQIEIKTDIELSSFNEKLKQALDFNPKDKSSK